jgi:hypothetical protein
MIVLIDGWWASGKSVVLGFLEGHPMVFSVPIHDMIMGIFTLEKDHSWLKNRDIKTLRRLLAHHTEYYRMAEAGISNRFDFYALDKTIMMKLKELDPWTPQKVIETIYRELFKVLYPHKNTIPTIFVTMGGPFMHEYGYSLNIFSDGKYIFIDRDPEGIMASSKIREMRKYEHMICPGDSRERFYKFDTPILKILQNRDHRERISKKYPDRTMTICFDELFEKKDEIMAKVAKFLNIPFDPVLTRWKYMGEENFDYGDRIIDRPKEKLTDFERKRIQDLKIKFYRKTPPLVRLAKCFLKNVLLKTSVHLQKIAKKFRKRANRIYVQ